MRRTYLDSNVLIALYSADTAEMAKRGMVENALAVFAQLKDSQLCTSMWAITEMVNVLVSNKKMHRGAATCSLRSKYQSKAALKSAPASS